MITFRPVRIGDLGRVVTGRTPPASLPSAFCGDIPFLTPTDIDGASRFLTTARSVSAAWDSQQGRVSLPPRSVCVVCIGATIGKICMTLTRSQSNQQINSIIVDDDAFDPFFVYYKLCTLKDTFRQRAAGAATPIINKTIFSDIIIEAPTLQEQRRIAAILSAYDDLIEVNRRRVAILGEIARRLFDEWFVHLRFPGHESVPVHKTADGPLPGGWESGVVGNLLTLHRGYDLPASERSPGNVPVMTGSGQNGTHNISKIAGPGVVTGRSGTVGPVFLVHDNFWPLNTALYVSAFTRVGPTFALYLLRNLDLRTRAGGAAVPTLNRNHVHALPALLPPEAISDTYERMAAPMLQQAWKLAQQTERLAAARDLLLPRLVSGELSVADAPAPGRLLEAAD